MSMSAPYGQGLKTSGSISTVWSSKRLIESCDYSVPLSEDTIEAARQKLPSQLNITKYEQFDELVRDNLNWIGPIAETVAHKLYSGPGMAFLEGEKLAELEDGQIAALNCALGSVFGRLVLQNADREIVVSVQDRRPADQTHARGYTSSGRMMLHTDPTDIACLACLSEGNRGGDSLFVSSDYVHDKMSKQAPELARELFRSWDWYMGSLETGKAKITKAPVFADFSGKLSCKYVSYMLRRGPDGTEKKLEEVEKAALDMFDRIANEETSIFSKRMLRGESVWMNNYKVLHGRQAFEDNIQNGVVRRLLRLWVKLKDDPGVPPCFLQFDDQLFENATDNLDLFKPVHVPSGN